jgi:hypothetical protein
MISFAVIVAPPFRRLICVFAAAMFNALSGPVFLSSSLNVEL